MQRHVLIISSDHTGHGHKSITQALHESIESDLDVTIHVVDGFSLGGKLLRMIGNSYGPITRKAEFLWKMIWKITAVKASLVNLFIELQIRNNFITLLDKIKPDVILSVHPNFNGSVINILEKRQTKIPFITFIADLVNIYPLWADPRADYIISPTHEAAGKCIEYGVTEDKIKLFGFPVRAKFFRKSTNPKVEYRPDRPLNFLIMSGGEGVGNMEKIASTLLRHFNCNVKIVAGRNEKLKLHLEKSLCGYKERVEIHGFTENIQDLMFASDIALTRASPNVMFEAIASNTPLILTGALSGQEEDNPKFAEGSNLGVVCKNTDEIHAVVAQLLENNGEKLNSIIKSQQAFINLHAAEDIVHFINQTGETGLHRNADLKSKRQSKLSVIYKSLKDRVSSSPQ